MALILSGAHTAVSAQNDTSVESALQDTLEAHLSAYNAEDAVAALAPGHTKSPVFDSMSDALPSQLAGLDARTDIERFRFIGHDDEFAVARVRYRTVDNTGAAFMDQVRDAIVLFHQENGEWKLWSELNLGVMLE